MNLIDSSCWLEYFSGTKTGDEVSKAIEDTSSLVVPTIILYEVFKKILREKDENIAIFVVAQMKQGIVVDLDSDLSVFAARVGRDYDLSLADSIIYATALKHNCTLWTQDKHFAKLNNVKYFMKTSNGA